MGRVTKYTQATTGGTGSPYVFGYQYNNAGMPTDVTYPTGRTLTTTYDVMGRASGLSGVQSGVTTNYAGAALGASSAIKYWAHGPMYQLNFGSINETFGFNDRLQSTDITAKLGAATLFAASYGYCTSGSSCASNNGNVLTQTITPGGSTGYTQNYLYDRLNRITLAIENYSNPPTTPVCPSSATLGANACCQQFAPDQYGNVVTTSVNLGSFSGPSQFDSSNRMAPNRTDGLGTGWDYNAAGQFDRDTDGNSYAFDIEGRMTAYCPNQPTPKLCWNQLTSGAAVYKYDGSGRRVQKKDLDGTVTTYVYDAAGVP